MIPAVGCPGELGQFETVTVKMDGMNIVAGIAHADAIALACFKWNEAGVIICVIGNATAVDGPQVESAIGGVVLRERHLECTSSGADAAAPAFAKRK